MKKLLAFIIMAAMLLAMAGCGSQPAVDENVGGVNDTQTEEQGLSDEEFHTILDALGMSEEEFLAMESEQQQALLNEMGAVLEQQQQQQEQQQQEAAKEYTPEDVMAGGSYKVVLGDYMNSITLYYENGKLVKLVESFQKSFDEEVEDYVAEGDALAEYGFNFIDWANAPLQEILDGMKDYGGFGQYQITAME